VETRVLVSFVQRLWLPLERRANRPNTERYRVTPADGHPLNVVRVRDTFGGLHVGQVVLPAMRGGSPALPNRQVNAPLRRSNDLPYGFSRPPILLRTHVVMRRVRPRMENSL